MAPRLLGDLKSVPWPRQGDARLPRLGHDRQAADHMQSNLLLSPVFQGIFVALLQVLAPFPEARAAVAQALSGAADGALRAKCKGDEQRGFFLTSGSTDETENESLNHATARLPCYSAKEPRYSAANRASLQHVHPTQLSHALDEVLKRNK